MWIGLVTIWLVKIAIPPNFDNQVVRKETCLLMNVYSWACGRNWTMPLPRKSYEYAAIVGIELVCVTCRKIHWGIFLFRTFKCGKMHMIRLLESWLEKYFYFEVSSLPHITISWMRNGVGKVCSFWLCMIAHTWWLQFTNTLSRTSLHNPWSERNASLPEQYIFMVFARSIFFCPSEALAGGSAT